MSIANVPCKRELSHPNSTQNYHVNCQEHMTASSSQGPNKAKSSPNRADTMFALSISSNIRRRSSPSRLSRQIHRQRLVSLSALRARLVPSLDRLQILPGLLARQLPPLLLREGASSSICTHRHVEVLGFQLAAFLPGAREPPPDEDQHDRADAAQYHARHNDCEVGHSANVDSELFKSGCSATLMSSFHRQARKISFLSEFAGAWWLNLGKICGGRGTVVLGSRLLFLMPRRVSLWR